MYDLEKDPSEMKNVYDDPAYAEVRETMHKRLAELREKIRGQRRKTTRNF